MKYIFGLFVSIFSAASPAADLASYRFSDSSSSTQVIRALTSQAIQPFSENVIPFSAASAVMAFKEESGVTRGPAEVSIYQRVAHGTVLIAAKDGMGSGALLTPSGHIVTNYHVIQGADRVRVFFKPITPSGKVGPEVERVGTVLKVNEISDLALIKVDSIPPQARPIPMVTASQPQVGEDAHAIGHPRGQVWTYTRGYVSQVRGGYEWSASENGVRHMADVIQTQTPINPGNSGGPLVNANGGLIGLNSFGDPKSPGLNFAVASSEIEKFLKQQGSVRAQKVSVSKKSCGNEPVGQERREIRGDGPTTVIIFDTQCNGKSNVLVFIPDDRTKAITMAIFDEGKKTPKIVLKDLNRDGQYDVTYADLDGDGSFDVVGENGPGELIASNVRRFPS
jgi:S1-C subfamily serine protease